MKQESRSNTTPTTWFSDKDLAERYGISRMSVWRWSRAGHLPAPRKIGPNTTRWAAEEIEAHDRAQMKGAA